MTPCSVGSARPNIGGQVYRSSYEESYPQPTRGTDNGSIVLTDATDAIYTTADGQSVPFHVEHPPSGLATCF